MGAGPWHGVAWHGWAIDSRAVCSPYGGLCEQHEDAREGQDDDDANDGGGDKQEVAGRDVMPDQASAPPLPTRQNVAHDGCRGHQVALTGASSIGCESRCLHPFGFEVAKRTHLRGEDLGDFRDYLASRAGLPRVITLD
jgi:hypothetical protein